MADLNVNSIGDASGGNTASINGFTPTASNMAGRNRIINGDMRIDQRNAGALVSPAVNGDYYVDRWRAISGAAGKFSIGQNAGSVTPPAGYANYLGLTSLSAYSVGAGENFAVRHSIEGFNCVDLAWGTSSAQTITISFWVRSSLTGTFGATLRNSAQNRTYPFTYAISAANTWEQKTVSVAGDTAGTWLTNNGIGIELQFSIGAGASVSGGTVGDWNAGGFQAPSGATSVVGTSGATFYITGVQLEAGSVATPFEHVDYSEMLRRCQRYYYSVGGYSVYEVAGSMGNAYLTDYCFAFIHPQVEMRTLPTLTKSGNWEWSDWTNAGSATGTLTIAPNDSNTKQFFIFSNGTTSGLTALRSYYLRAANDTTARLQFSAEL